MKTRESNTKYSISDPINPQPMSFQAAEGTGPNNTQPTITSEDVAAANQSQRQSIETMAARAAGESTRAVFHSATGSLLRMDRSRPTRLNREW